MNVAFPGCVLRTTRGHRLPSLRDEHPGVVRTPAELEGGAVFSWLREEHPSGDEDVAAPF
jgi:hypothetical protein